MKKIVFVVLRILIAIIALLFITFGVIGIRDHLWHLLVIGVIILFMTVFWNAFINQVDKRTISPLWKRIRSITVGFLVMIALFDVGLMITGAVVAHSDLSNEDLTVVVLGTDVDGDQPSDLLKARLDTAAKYLKQYPEKKVIVTGKGRGEYTEAEVMYQYLINEGIDANRIYQENHAQSTQENFRFSLEIIRKENLPEEMLVATNNYHQWRASIYAKEQGITVKALSGPTPWYLLFPLSERERFIIVTQWLGLSPDLVNKYQEL